MQFQSQSVFFFAVNQYLINCPRAPAIKEFRYTYDKLEKKGYDDRISYLSKYLQIFIGKKYTNKISYFQLIYVFL